MEPLYRPEGVEERWQRTWEEEGLYAAQPGTGRETFVVAHPPPNVTGALHTGHALQISLADALVRWHRMRGFETAFLTGYDHAGISTQNAVEKHLASQGRTRQELGRAAFEQVVWDWLHQYGRTIMGQFRRMGASMDYARERFTMDDDYVRAVMRFFVHLYRKGWIYRANRIINWCPFHETALSDLELIHDERDDALAYVLYPFADGAEGGVTIATARPATILADVAVAVHPQDDRWREAIGRDVLVPFVERVVPVITDERVDPAFGTGALKVTPAHDPLDFEIGRDHGLPEPAVIGPDGRMNESAGELAGLSQDEAEERILAWLRDRGRLVRRESYRHTLALCERCKHRIEPLISLQWWCTMEELKKPALESLRARSVEYHPESQHRFAIDSLESAPDWNISRQLWWGHQLPVWECPDGHLTVEETAPGSCGECGSRDLKRSDDVLDTWFSSALWPFAILGWPEETPELRAWYPGTLNTTAREIIRLWENRMIFSGLELLGEVPFRHVIIHTTVLAPDGRRMSKSLGTGMDPLDLVDAHGADATRYGLLKLSSSQDVRFSYGAVEEGRKLANKLWNASRLLLGAGPVERVEARPDALEERWMLARLDEERAQVEADFSAFDFAHLVDRLYHLTFDDFCDWYLEAVKPRLREAAVRATAYAALERLLKLLHSVMPHVTEEIWANLPARETRLIVAPWPEPDASHASHARALDRVQEAAAIFRRSGVLVELSGDERRIFDAVVKPDRMRADGNLEAEIERLRNEIARAERMLANDRFVSKAPPDVVEGEREKLARYRRELEALEGA
ncbi:MAG: valine--tRNA ligase [Thermoleophilia bacterium]|nr:valine--tRNA ligase [Thermoleophilia bacterium]